MAKFIQVETIRGLKTFRRAGFTFHEDQPQLLRLEDLEDEQIDRLRAESSLRVTDLSITEAEAHKRGWPGAVAAGQANDPRTPMEQAIGDYPPPNARLNHSAPAPVETERSTVKPGASAEEKAAAAKTAAAKAPSKPDATPTKADPFSDDDGTDAGGGKSKRSR